jgi:antitoxin component YwqK of YwqJK toxin-antitoxin module
MKQLFSILLLILITHLATAQLIQKDDGKYYNGNDELYSGTYIEYYPSGDKRIEMNLLLGQKHGTTIIYFDKQIVNEIRSFKHDLMDGTWLTFNQKSIKIGEANYLNGVKHGKWYIWDDNGTKRYEMEYENGAKVGTWRIWDEKGTLVEEKNYTAK